MNIVEFYNFNNVLYVEDLKPGNYIMINKKRVNFPGFEREELLLSPWKPYKVSKVRDQLKDPLSIGNQCENCSLSNYCVTVISEKDRSCATCGETLYNMYGLKLISRRGINSWMEK